MNFNDISSDGKLVPDMFCDMPTHVVSRWRLNCCQPLCSLNSFVLKFFFNGINTGFGVETSPHKNLWSWIEDHGENKEVIWFSLLASLAMWKDILPSSLNWYFLSYKAICFWAFGLPTEKNTFGSKVYSVFVLVQGLVCKKQKLTLTYRRKSWLEECWEMHRVDKEPGETGLENGQAFLKCG